VRRSAREGTVVGLDAAEASLTVQANAYDVLLLRDLRVALDKLAVEQREAILLVGLEGLNYEEAAAMLNIPVGTIRSRLSRGRDRLRELMGMDDETEVPAGAVASENTSVKRQRIPA